MVMTAMYGINKVGLRERPSYDQLIGYLQGGQEKIRYPDRFAKRVRESPQLSNLLDGEGFSINDINEQQMNHAKEIAKQLAILQAGGDAHLLRVSSQEPSNVNADVVNLDDQLQDQAEQIAEVINQDNTNQQNQSQSILQQNTDHLNTVHQQQLESLHGAGSLLQPPLPPPPKSSQASSSSGPMQFDISSPKAKQPLNPQEPKGKGRPVGSKAKAKSLNLLRRVPPDDGLNVPIPQSSGSESTATGGGNGNGGNGTTTESTSSSRSQSQPPSSSIPNKEKFIIDGILGMSNEGMKNELKEMPGRHKTSGSREELIGRLVLAKLGEPSAPVQEYIKKHPNYKRGRNATPPPRRGRQ